jgi:BirA family biotin operon repressor/biotin-[acetyl-CoA-carboxylase] ligase
MIWASSEVLGRSVDVLFLLQDGACHSGEELGIKLGVSRAAIWKQLRGLKARGVEIEAVPGRGYRLVKGLDPWRRDLLLDGIGEGLTANISELILEGRVTSTNDIVQARMSGLHQGVVVCLADEQTHGRGRRGRDWYSPVNSSFYGSFGFRFEGGVSSIAGLSLAAGLVVARALDAFGVHGVRIKWPNDLVIGDAKLGGILVELHAEANGPCSVVVGIGVNLSLPEGATKRIGRDVVDVASLRSGPMERNLLGGLIVGQVVALLSDYARKGFAAYKDEWQKYDALMGCEVEVLGVERRTSGIACGVDSSGILQIETAGGLFAVNSGEVSVRKR